jgi:beta-glucanase (GH16 family)
VRGDIVWADECDGDAGQPPDPSRWGVLETDGWQPTSELQTYTRDPRNASYDGEGHLVIAAVRQRGVVTSARLSARHATPRHLFRYGWFEARLWATAAAGAWPAWWLLGEDDRFGWPECGEIDIMEAPCCPDTAGRVHQGTHSPAAGAGGTDGAKAVGVGVQPSTGRWTEGFHRYAVRWEPSVIEFFIDDVSTGLVTRAAVEAAGGIWRFDDRRLSPVLNLAVGGWAGQPGAWSRAELVVDWVRVHA